MLPRNSHGRSPDALNPRFVLDWVKSHCIRSICIISSRNSMAVIQVVEGLCFIVVLSFCVYLLKTSSGRHLPPGPKPAPLIGNLLQIPSERPEVRFTEWASLYGKSFFELSSARANSTVRRCGPHHCVREADCHPKYFPSRARSHGKEKLDLL